jgi:hypothetical protein
MADDLKYGYKGAEPTQSFGNNTGVFDPNDINNLIADNKWTQYGQLELIETQSYSSGVANIDFTSIDESTYNVHFMTISNLKCTAASQSVGIQFYESGTLETSTVYQYSNHYQNFAPSGNNVSSGGYSHIRLFSTSSQAINGINGYVYFYNLGDSTKYSFVTNQHFMEAASGTLYSYVGNGNLPQTSTVDGIRINNHASNNFTSFDISLYGIRYS